MAFLLSWLVLGGIVGSWIATRRGFSQIGGIVGGVMLGPVLALLMLLVTPDRKCPHCAEFVKPDARVCRHCGRDLTTGPVAGETVW